MSTTLEDRLDDDCAPAWRPDPGDRISGQVVGISERAGYNEHHYPVVTLRRDDGERFALHALHGVLSAQLAELRPTIGDKIAVMYVGKVDAAGGPGTYRHYKAVKDVTPQLIDWSKYRASVPSDALSIADRARLAVHIAALHAVCPIAAVGRGRAAGVAGVGHHRAHAVTACCCSIRAMISSMARSFALASSIPSSTEAFASSMVR